METLREMKRYVIVVLRRSVTGPATTKALDYQALFALAALVVVFATRLPPFSALFVAAGSQFLAMMWSKDVG